MMLVIYVFKNNRKEVRLDLFTFTPPPRTVCDSSLSESPLPSLHFVFSKLTHFCNWIGFILFYTLLLITVIVVKHIVILLIKGKEM